MVQQSDPQTNNSKGVANPNEVSSALFNANTNSGSNFVEIYEKWLWGIMRQRGSGPSADPVTDDPNATCFDFRKNQHEQPEEMHARRKWLAGNAASDDP